MLNSISMLIIPGRFPLLMLEKGYILHVHIHYSVSAAITFKVNANVPPHFLNIAYCYNGGQKNLGLCEKALTSNYWYVGLYAY